MFAFVSTSPMGGHQNWTTHLEPSGMGTDIESEIDCEVPGSILSSIADMLFAERQVERMLDQSRDNFIAVAEHEALQLV